MLSAFLLAASMLGTSPANAADYSREVRPGLTSFKRLLSGSRPQNVYAVRADLSSPNIGLHASADVRSTEWYVDTLTFAENVGAIAAINGDWSCTTCTGSNYLHPLGLAVSDGVVWNDHIATDAIGNYWGFLGCTLDKQCDLGRARPLTHASMASSPLQTPELWPLRYQNALGANGVVLINDGVASSGCFDTSTTNPRSAACVEADGTHLWMVVVDGRGSGGGTGMSCDEFRTLLLGDPFRCWDAVMLDGGGSSTLVVEDTNRSADCNPRGDRDLCVKNNPSDGSPRRVANHLGITWEDAPDSRCRTPNGRWCDGGRMHTCEGGRYTGTRDCAAGETCQEDGNYAFCVDPRCPEGNGLRVNACVDATRIASCNDGVYGVGDCAGFGLVCGTDAGGAACMDGRCAAGPDSGFCAASGAVVQCTDGVYAEASCPAGTHCASDGAGPFCSDDRCPGADAQQCEGDTLVTCARGAYQARDCAAEGLACADNACRDGTGADVPLVEDSATPNEAPAVEGASMPGTATTWDAVGCNVPGGRAPTAGIVTLAGLALLPRRRRPTVAGATSEGVADAGTRR